MCCYVDLIVPRFLGIRRNERRRPQFDKVGRVDSDISLAPSSMQPKLQPTVCCLREGRQTGADMESNDSALG